jgi:DNA-directed RNA polymerase subunit RPC12/RpoP
MHLLFISNCSKTEVFGNRKSKDIWSSLMKIKLPNLNYHVNPALGNMNYNISTVGYNTSGRMKCTTRSTLGTYIGASCIENVMLCEHKWQHAVGFACTYCSFRTAAKQRYSETVNRKTYRQCNDQTKRTNNDWKNTT